jgi:hypothetical protein
MNDRQLEIAGTFFRNVESLSFGTALLKLKIHAGECTDVTYITSENIRRKGNGDDVLK